MPFFTGISESKVEAYYWEKQKDKKTAAIFFHYYVKYPFSDFELQKIILDFEVLQKTASLSLDEIDESIETANSLEELAAKYHEINAIVPQLEGGNKQHGDLLIKKIQGILNAVSFKELRAVPGSLTYILMYGNKPLQASMNPVIKSNCAGNFRTSISPDSITLNYAYNGCFDNKSNNITINYQIDEIAVKHVFSIDINTGKIEFSVVNGFQLEEESGDSSMINTYKLSLEVNSKFPAKFSITKILMEVPGGNPILFDNLDIPFSGKGVHGFSVPGKKPLKRSFYSTKQGELVSGSIFFVNALTRESGVLKFYNEKLSINF
jgi:hypothetical protein